MKIAYTEEAIEDVERLQFFIAIKSPKSAVRIVDEIFKQIEMLENFPRLGFPIESLLEDDEIRELVVNDHVVRYSIQINTVWVLRIWHGKELERSETINESGEEYKA